MIITEKEAEEFLEQMGFPVIRRVLCTSARQAEEAAQKLGYPVALKVVSPTILHKSDVGGVLLDLSNPGAVRKGFLHLRRIKGAEGVMVQEYLNGDFLLLGLKKDPTFGHTVAVGSGGIYTEILQDASFRVCPITARDAEEMMEELKIYPILRGVRGGQDRRKEVRTLLLRLSRLAQQYPMITELDINPLILHRHGVTVADARMVVESSFLS